MTSIKRRLTLSLTLVCCLLWGAGSVCLYLAMRAGLIAEFDQSLQASAQSLAALTSQDNGNLEFDFDPVLMPAFARGERPDYFQLWRPDGSAWERSPSLSLGDGSLPLLAGRLDAPAFLNLRLPDGLAGRAIGVRFRATQTDDESTAPAPARPRVEVAMVVARHRAQLDRRLSVLALALLLVGAGTALATASLVPLLVGRGLRPLRSLAEHAATIDASALAVRFPTAEMPVELAPIGHRLNELLARLEASFERERRFSADVAHELRTPIAELRALAEVGLKWPEGQAADARALRDVLAISLRLEAITAGLLALARCEAGLQPIAREGVRVAEILESTWRPFAGRARERRLAVRFDVPDDLRCEADPERFRMVLTNLLSNAVEYCPREGSLLWRATLGDGRVKITLSNDAPDLRADDLPHLFERFWRKDEARTSDAHSGLGLALAKAFAESMDMQLNAELRAPGILSIHVSAPSVRTTSEPRASADPGPRSADVGMEAMGHVEAVD